MKNKKVLLRERKRHTARCTANTPSGQVPPPPPRPGTPLPPLRPGIPLPLPPGQVPPLPPPLARYPPPPPLPAKVPPPPPPSRPEQVPLPRPDLARYTPPGVNRQTNWKYYLPHPSDAGGNDKLKLLKTFAINSVEPPCHNLNCAKCWCGNTLVTSRFGTKASCMLTNSPLYIIIILIRIHI